MRPNTLPPPAGAVGEDSHTGLTHGLIRSLIWLYFILIIVEGPLRKWILPELANQLILVRDPVVFMIYAVALGSGVFRMHWITLLLMVVGAASLAAAMLAGHGNPGVALYGLDSNFLHLPLIFIIGDVMTRRDVLKVGRWILVLTIPMAVLMVMQFRSHPNAYVNVGPGGAVGSQMAAALGKIRPPGLFTFVTGSAMFLTLASAFVVFGFLERKIYNRLFLCLCSLALILSVMVSSSRLVLGGISVVFLMIGVIGLYNRVVIRSALAMLVPLGIVFLVAASLDIFHEGKVVFEARLENTGDSSATLVQTASSWSERVLGDFIAGFSALESAPALGRGIGYGTNVGARLLTGNVGFLANEREWGRIVIEMGPILAAPYLLARVAIVLLLFQRAAQSAGRGNFLPMLLFGSCGLGMMNGQFGVAATLGFIVLQAGLCLAASHGEAPPSPETAGKAGSATGKRHRGRSVYAEAMLGPPKASDDSER